jgi:hypothetical protein
MDKQELIKYYETLIDTFSTPGWKLIMEKVEEVKSPLSDISNCKDEKEFLFKKGRVAELNYWLSFEKLHKEAYKELIDGTEDF